MKAVKEMDLKYLRREGGKQLKNTKLLKKFIFSLVLAMGLALSTAILCSFAETVVYDGHTYTVEPVDGEKYKYVGNGEVTPVKITDVTPAIDPENPVELYCDDFMNNGYAIISISSDVKNVTVSHNGGFEYTDYDGISHYKMCYDCNVMKDEAPHDIKPGEVQIEATEDALGVRNEWCDNHDCDYEGDEIPYRKENSNPYKYPDNEFVGEFKNAFISDKVPELSQKVTLEDGTEVEIVLQDPNFSLGWEEKAVKKLGKKYDGYNWLEDMYIFEVTDPTMNLDSAHDDVGKYEVEHSYQAKLNLYEKRYSQPPVEDTPVFAKAASTKAREVIKGRAITQFPKGIRIGMQVPIIRRSTGKYDEDKDWDINEIKVNYIKDGEDERFIPVYEFRIYSNRTEEEEKLRDGSDETFRVFSVLKMDEDDMSTPEKRSKYIGDLIDSLEEGETLKVFAFFWTDHLSRYSLLDPGAKKDGANADASAETTAAQTETTSSKKGGLNGPKTGENMDAVYILSSLMSLAAVGVYLTLRKRYSFN